MSSSAVLERVGVKEIAQHADAITAAPTARASTWWREFWQFSLVLVPLVLLHIWTTRDTEPLYNNDETRHVMTGVFMRDALADGGWRSPRAYAEKYYLQYPALGLLAWPPLFYGAEGLVMSALGTSFITARLTIALFSILALIYVYRWVRLSSGQHHIAVLATLLFGLSPLGFSFSRYVMLEMPTLAWAMMSVFYFERYLADGRRRDALLVGLTAAAAALTRFDAVLLLPYFAIRLVALRRVGELKRRAVLGAIVIALVLAGPYYFMTWKMYGGTIAKAAEQGTMPTSKTFDVERNLAFYPTGLHRHAGLVVSIVAAGGLVASLCRRRPIGIPMALLLATYVTFTPLAELEDRHAIYWVPALCALAAEAFEWLSRSFRIAANAGLMIIAAIPCMDNYPLHVRGYEDAARRVLEQPREANVVFFDGGLSAGFIYQMRHLDPTRSVQVLRGDKLVYGVLSDPAAGFKVWCDTPEEILDLLHKHDPDWIVIEAPQAIFPDLSAPKLLRETLREHPERYEHVKEFDVPLRTDHRHFAGRVLEFYRPIKRNPHREKLREIPMLSMGGKSVGPGQ